MKGRFKYKTVLLIDDSYIDNVINEKIISRYLFAEHILLFESAQAATAFLEKSICQQEAMPEIIFLDLRMPEVDGYGFLEEIKDMHQLNLDEIKIYILSSSLDPADLKRIKKNKLIKGFINKPLTELILNKL